MKPLPYRALACLTAIAFLTAPALGDTDPVLKKVIQEKLAPLYSKESEGVTVCLQDELEVSGIEQKVIFPLAEALKLADINALKAIVADPLIGLAPRQKFVREKEGIAEFNWDTKKKTSWATFLTGWSKIDYVELRIVDFSVSPEDRTDKLNPNKISLRLRLDIRGEQDGKKVQDRATLQATSLNKDGAWTVSSIKAIQGMTLVQNGTPAFLETTVASNLVQAKTYRRTEAIRRGGYALSVADINGDGMQDLFVGMKGSPEIWLGQKNGTFAKMEQNAFANEHYIKTAVFADFKNNGHPGAVLTRYLEAPKTGNFGPAIGVAIYENNDGSFVLSPKPLAGNSNLREPMPAAVADFNGDGFLDFYIGYPGRQDFSQMGAVEEKPLNQVQGLYMNDRRGGFLDFTESSIKWNNASDYNGRLFPHSSLAGDFNMDGKQDLIVADDRGNLSPFFVNKGNGKMVESSGEFGLVNRGYSMSLAAGDLSNKGLTDLALTNVYLTEFDRLKRSCARHFHADLLGKLGKGLRIFKAGNGKSYKEATRELILDYPGDAPAGVAFLDYNGDGFQDIYVVNGLWSGTKGGQNLGSMFSALATESDLFYGLRPANSFRFMDILSNFKGTIENYARVDSVREGKERPSLGGFQRNRLYRNNGNDTFTEVGFLEGVDSMADGYIVARADLNHDGKMDLVLRNADPGTDEYQFPVIQIFQNQSKRAGNSVTLTFKGLASNRDSFGLFAKATIGKRVQVQHLIANSGSVQDQKIINFGLGSAKLISKLEVHWPSGKVEVLRNIKPGYHQIDEPKDGLNMGRATTPLKLDVSAK